MTTPPPAWLPGQAYTGVCLGGPLDGIVVTCPPQAVRADLTAVLGGVTFTATYVATPDRDARGRTVLGWLPPPPAPS